jgi:hypothetical protein
MKQNKTRRISIPLLTAIAVIIIVSAAAILMELTSAGLFGKDMRENIIGIKQLIFSARLEENFSAPTAADPAAPGETISKEPWLLNDGSIDAFARVRVFPTLVAADGQTLLEARVGTQLTLVGLNTAKWKDGGDGWYYYIEKIAPQTKTEALFRSVTLAGNISDNYSGAKLTVTLIYEAVETGKWHYRTAWWNNTNTDAGSTTLNGALAGIDDALRVIAQ